MATIKGQNLRLLVGDSEEELLCIAASTGCTVHVSAQVEEDTTKDEDDDWLRQQVTGLAWDAQVEALVIDDSDDTYRPGAHPIDQLTVGREYTLRFSRTLGTAGSQNRDTTADRQQLTGRAILNDLQITAQNDNTVTATAQFTGSADLTPYTPPVTAQAEE